MHMEWSDYFLLDSKLFHVSWYQSLNYAGEAWMACPPPLKMAATLIAQFWGSKVIPRIAPLKGDDLCCQRLQHGLCVLVLCYVYIFEKYMAICRWYCRWQYGSIAIHVAVVASQVSEITRNFPKIRTSAVFDWTARVPDRQTDGRAIAYSTLAEHIMLSRAKNHNTSIANHQ